ncbi:hypothetical protein [Bradyrhizobium sp. BWA-3-5]|uniref:hypothetical protein n=1 Tax=Bradyrhizobium sp. BWA-3-5 TaxID=3080013 RepID=UPI00293EDEC9|nr:hypothetical protein [Bradyrhizobium sp. BWA-3-5]WOH68098.1 hypothetical protein RX331_10445 [Bradyrhizobium sp. BWA-3-5]
MASLIAILAQRWLRRPILARRTSNGKFLAVGELITVPKMYNKAYIEEKKRAEEDARYKVPEQLLNPKQWCPKDGIYASPGADFGDRCMKSGEVVVGLSEGSISSGKAECKVVELMSTGLTVRFADLQSGGSGQTSIVLEEESRRREAAKGSRDDERRGHPDQQNRRQHVPYAEDRGSEIQGGRRPGDLLS